MIKACTLNTAKEALFHFIQIGCISIVPLRMCRSNTSEDNTRGEKKEKSPEGDFTQFKALQTTAYN